MPAERVPQWYDDAKFGAMICWTPASVPAYAPTYAFDLGEVAREDRWVDFLKEIPDSLFYRNTMLIPGSTTERHHAEHHAGVEYDAFVDEFRAGLDRWDPEPLADLLERAGVRYVVLVTKHLDGFMLWPSRTRNPYKPNWQSERDIVGELAAAVRARGIRFCAYYSGGIDWTFPTALPMTTIEDVRAAVPQGPQFLAYADAHWRELIERYAPSMLWNDMGYPTAADPDALFAAYREHVPDGVVNDRFYDVAEARGPGAFDVKTVENERDYSGVPDEVKWEACRAVGTSWGYNRRESEATYTSSTELIHELVDITARGGNLLLALTPTATGEVPFGQARRLLDIGWWLRTNGSAVYDTRPWERPVGRTSGGLDVRYTASDAGVHAIVLGTPPSNDVELDVQLRDRAEVTLEGRPVPLRWEASEHGVRVTLPEPPADQPALALRLAPADAVRTRRDGSRP